MLSAVWNAIKPQLTPEEIQDLARRGLGPHVEVAETVEFTDGFFSAAYGLHLRDGRDLVLKVAPARDLKLLRYEFDLMRTEIHFYKRAGAAGVPLPGLRFADPDAGVLLIDRLRGRTLESVRREIPLADRLELRRAIGRCAAAITAINGPLFGYPRRDGRTRSTSWRESFLAIVDDILADAVDLGAELPAPADEIAATVRRHAPLLDEVTTPSLLHYDLWDGNIFVVEEGGRWRIEAIIDGERAFYGDPIAELVSAVAFIDEEEGAAVIDGMLGRPLTQDEQTRLRLYTAYLFLILVTEGRTRGFKPEEHEPTRRWALGYLESLLISL
jgi:aminoglycoside phosphotransferase (APT) family kinase protein